VKNELHTQQPRAKSSVTPNWPRISVSITTLRHQWRAGPARAVSCLAPGAQMPGMGTEMALAMAMAMATAKVVREWHEVGVQPRHVIHPYQSRCAHHRAQSREPRIRIPSLRAVFSGLLYMYWALRLVLALRLVRGG
jgi:hypothetical protein